MTFPARLVCLSILVALSSTWAAEELAPTVEEHLTVHATRLPHEEEPVQTVPAHVTVLTREDIARSGARTLQDALALEAGVILYDQVGNDIEKTLDLRGFAGGRGTAVFVDGVRMNDTRNNTVALESVPLEAVERIEITRGSAAGLIGGGSEAGIIHVLTRRGTEPGGSLSVGVGSDGGRRATGHAQGALRSVELFASAEHDETDGFRASNGQGELDRFAFRAGLPLREKHRLDLTGHVSHLDAGAPGALRQDEADADFWQNQFNLVDGNDEKTRQAALAYRGQATEAWSLAADVFVRDLRAEGLTSGRTAAAFGQGFFLDEDTSAVGSMVEATHRVARSTLTLGAEWSDGRVDARGWFTSPPDFATPDPDPVSDNRSDRQTVALFVRESFSPVPAWTLQAGLRTDQDRIEYTDFLSTDKDSLSFSDVTGRLGAVWNPTPSAGAFASYAESFLPPTPEQLFAFPGFGSNEDLKPERSQSWEIGWRQRFGSALDLTATGFLIDTQDEIVFDPDPVPGNPFGRNVNAGETRREGLEIAARGRAGVRASWFARGTLLDATFRNGVTEGNDVPLVPGYRLAAGFDVPLWKSLQLHLDALRVGSQVLDNDASNEAPELPAYTVVNANLRWQLHPKVALFVEGRNLFDERYATRGIYSLDFQDPNFENAVFVTPAPGRRVFGGATLTF